MKKAYTTPCTTALPLQTIQTLMTSRFNEDEKDPVKEDKGDGEEPEPMAKRHTWDIWADDEQ